MGAVWLSVRAWCRLPLRLHNNFLTYFICPPYAEYKRGTSWYAVSSILLSVLSVHHHQLTPLEQSPWEAGSCSVKKFTAFYENWTFITYSQEAVAGSFYCLCLDLPCDFSPSCFPRFGPASVLELRVLSAFKTWRTIFDSPTSCTLYLLWHVHGFSVYRLCIMLRAPEVSV